MEIQNYVDFNGVKRDSNIFTSFAIYSLLEYRENIDKYTAFKS